MKLGVTGTRFTDKRQFIFDKLNEIAKAWNIELLISGSAKGVDTFCEEWAKKNNIPIESHPPDWKNLGKRAAFIRNAEIVRAADILVGFPLIPRGESHGTEHTIGLAQKRSIPVFVFPISKTGD